MHKDTHRQTEAIFQRVSWEKMSKKCTRCCVFERRERNEKCFYGVMLWWGKNGNKIIWRGKLIEGKGERDWYQWSFCEARMFVAYAVVQL